nr:uncharacterized protein LOC109756398 [Aegilops tauschii subsp. strangulata]
MATPPNPPPPPPPPPFRTTDGAPPSPLRSMPLLMPTTLAQGTLLACHDAEWRTLFEVQFQKSGVADHLTGLPHSSDPAWLQDDALVVCWLYNRINTEISGLVHQGGTTAATVWDSIRALFLENREHQLVILATEFRRIEQGSSSIISYFARLKECADRLADLDEVVQDRDQVLNIIRGLHPRFRYVVPILTMQTPFPSFLRCQAFLLLEESRHAEETPHEIAMHVGHAPAHPSSGDHNNRSNGGGR